MYKDFQLFVSIFEYRIMSASLCLLCSRVLTRIGEKSNSSLEVSNCTSKLNSLFISIDQFKLKNTQSGWNFR